jgi:type I restriction enzyme S subunit
VSPWPTVAIADFAKTSAGGTPSKTNRAFYDGGTIPWLLSGEVGVPRIFNAKNYITEAGMKGSSAKLFPPQTVLVAMYGATAGEVGILDFESATNQAVCGILPGANHVPDFLYYFMLLAKANLVSQAIGNAQPNISQAKVKSLKVPLPPLEEQKRIVAVLDQAFAALDRARALAQANLADAEEAFEVGLDKIISEQASCAAQTTLGAICSFENGDRGKNYPGRKAFVPEGVPFINAGHLEDGKIDWAAMNFIPEEHYRRLGNGKVKPDDILFCLRGSLGKFGKIDREGLGAIASSLVIVRAKENVLTDFLSIYFRSKTCKQMIEEYAGGAAQPNLSAGDLKKFKVLLPDKDAQQCAIQAHDAFSDARDRLYSSYSAKLFDVAELRQSLLQKAFAGELT